MKLNSITNYEQNAYQWVVEFSEWSKLHPIHRVLIGDGKKTYIDNGDLIARSKYRSQSQYCLKGGKDNSEKLAYYILWGDSRNIMDNYLSYKAVFKL